MTDVANRPLRQGRPAGDRSGEEKQVNLSRFFESFSPPSTNLVDVLRYWSNQIPDQVAFYFTDGEEAEERISYAQFDCRARAIAAHLQELGMQGQRALLLFPPGLEFVTAFFGCLYAGATAVPAYPPRRNRNMVRIQSISDDAEARCALTLSDVIDRTEGLL